MTAFLIDEMFPAAAAEILRTKYGHDAVQVGEVGLGQPTIRRLRRPPGPKAGLSSLRMSRTSPPSATWFWCSS